MFNKAYPKSCTVLDSIFEKCYQSDNLGFAFHLGCGTWASSHDSGIFYLNRTKGFQKYDFVGFRSTITIN
jgi:hypothetical protein